MSQEVKPTYNMYLAFNKKGKDRFNEIIDSMRVKDFRDLEELLNARDYTKEAEGEICYLWEYFPYGDNNFKGLDTLNWILGNIEPNDFFFIVIENRIKGVDKEYFSLSRGYYSNNPFFHTSVEVKER